MALVRWNLPFLDACHAAGALQSPVFALGSLEFLDYRTYPEPVDTGGSTSASHLFRARYGVDEFLDFDVNAESAVELDLGAPLPDRFRGAAGTVVDVGTAEHVFDVAQVVRNVHDMLRPGGAWVALSPLSWWQHGYVNFNPKLFQGVAAANGYEILVEGVFVRFRLPLGRKRFATVLTREHGVVRPQQLLWLNRVMSRVQPAQTTFCFCARKVEDAPFRAPTDVFGSVA